MASARAVRANLVASPDVAVAISAPISATAGTDVSYAVTISNVGGSDAAIVTLTNTLPMNTTFVSNTQTAGAAFVCTNPTAGAGGTITCTAPVLTAGVRVRAAPRAVDPERLVADELGHGSLIDT